MYYFELEQRIRHEELRREADAYRLAREAVRGQYGEQRARTGQGEPEGQVRSGRSRDARAYRAAA
ncbi:hypothetical protein [Streptomyces sp. MST-110588]|uniref:hypothetical protein n=1 Tax=Streptomyces sp. MST-110588 TaxID=2833628 RepID=UPI001F5C88BA|nr:hypothetical protein [Streptomyces sp. MST-110588]UNO39778.1 hypothetical protein KGS77_09500 [Streptomyces sp. MST-110588]